MKQVAWLVTWLPLPRTVGNYQEGLFSSVLIFTQRRKKKRRSQWEQMFQWLPSNRWQTHAVHSPEHSKLMLSNDNHVYLSIKGIFNMMPRFKVQGCLCPVHVACTICVAKSHERKRFFLFWAREQTGYWVYRLLHADVPDLCKYRYINCLITLWASSIHSQTSFTVSFRHSSDVSSGQSLRA